MKKDLVDLFRWNTELDIKDKDNKTVLAKVYIRIVGDVDYGQAQQHGLLASRKMRKILSDKESNDYQSIFFDIDGMSKEDLTYGVLTAEVYQFRDAAMGDVEDDVFKSDLPADAPLEDREKEQEVEENFVDNKASKLREAMEKRSEVRKTELEKMPIKKLRELFVEASTNYKCLEEFTNTFRDYCVFKGAYKDSKFQVSVFPSFESFRNSSPTLKKQLIDAYLKLEISGDQLKN